MAGVTVTVNVITLVDAAKEIVDSLQTIGVLNADGTFNTPTPDQDVKIAVLAEGIAVKFGLDVPAKVDKIVRLLPLILELAN